MLKSPGPMRPSLIFLLIAASAIATARGPFARSDSLSEYVNSLGQRMVRIQAGTFRMGNDQAVPAEKLGAHSLMSSGDYDERPVRRVTISQPFYMSETEVTVEQYSQFRPDTQDTGKFSSFVQGVSWFDAVAFAHWLSQKEGKNYRLPTEAEWEYACRAGTSSPFSSGDLPPEHGVPNTWGLKNLHTGVLEWCWDWHGLYPDEDQTDPVGRSSGVARVVRGGAIQGAIGNRSMKYGNPNPYYARSANRAGVAPAYQGQHLIGFRLVEAPLPSTQPLSVDVPFHQQAVRQTSANVELGPVASLPYFKRRSLLPIPPENVTAAAVEASGLSPAVMAHNHSPGLEVLSNGDLLAIFFSSSASFAEYWPNVTFIATRLRFGSEQWDMPELFSDFPDVNDQTALLWNERGTVRLFMGGVGLAGVPFRMSLSNDNGATWSDIRFPILVGEIRGIRGFYPQPINSAFRGADGTLYIPSDAIGGSSLLWASRDEGTTWFDTGGRTGGRHTTFAVLKDGSILGMGGKTTDIDGYMPKSISRNWGRSWEISKTPFAALGSNQRPTLIRLTSGRLFFAGDYQHYNGRQPKGITERGSYVALSEDEGQTWTVKTLPGTLPHETKVLPGLKEPWGAPKHDAGTLGYSVAKQAPNGVIHLITTMNHPALHFEMNEAWILDQHENTARSSVSSGSSVVLVSEEKYAGGATKAKWSGRRQTDGRYVLHGQQTSYYDNGRKQWEVSFNDGRKVGLETFSDRHGRKVWTWQHQDNGVSVWTQFWPNGQTKHESAWRDGRCEGVAKRWDSRGKLTGEFVFKDGTLVGEAGVWKYSAE